MINSIHKFILSIIDKTDDTAKSVEILNDLQFDVQYLDIGNVNIKGEVAYSYDSIIDEQIYYIRISETAGIIKLDKPSAFAVIDSNDMDWYFKLIRKLKLKQIRNGK